MEQLQNELNTDNRINSLYEQIELLKEELKQEHIKRFSESQDITDALLDLEEHGIYRYTYKGLLKSLKMDYEDFDELSEEALSEYLEPLGYTVDVNSNYLSKKLDNYIHCSDHGGTLSITKVKNGQEEILTIGLNSSTNRKELLASFNNDDMLMFSSDEFGNVEEIL